MDSLIRHSELLKSLDCETIGASLQLLPLSEEALAIWARARFHGLDSLPRLRMRSQPDVSAIAKHLMLIEVCPCLVSACSHCSYASDADQVQSSTSVDDCSRARAISSTLRTRHIM